MFRQSVIVVFILVFISIALAQSAGELRVVVTGIKNNNGDISIALDNTERAYLSRGKIPSFRKSRTKVIDKKAEFIFKDIPFGDYTIKLYHDENANKKIDKNFLGIPTEAYAFSNNVRASLGLPSYEKAKFSLNNPEMVIEIKMGEK